MDEPEELLERCEVGELIWSSFCYKSIIDEVGVLSSILGIGLAGWCCGGLAIPVAASSPTINS